MDEVGTALIAIALVLLAVFVPTAFIGGITGMFYRQFAVTIATATAISLFVSLTLSPALCALLFRAHASEHAEPSVLMRPVHAFFRTFDAGFDALARGYGRLVRLLARAWVVAHMSMATRYTCLRSSSSMRQDGRASPTGPTN